MEGEIGNMPEGSAPKTAKTGGTRLWIKLLAGLYGISILCALLIIFKGRPFDKARKPDMADLPGMGMISGKGSGVGWISIRGAIAESDGAKPWEKGVQQWVRRLRSMAGKKEIKAIVLDINSPGGSVGAVQEIYSEILRVRQENKKPVVALFGDVAASGAYYIAAACDSIVAHPGTITGSIGVIFNSGNVEGLFKKIGIRSEVIKSGKHKDIGSFTRGMTDEEREILQSLIDDAYSQFFTAVSEGRKMSESRLRPLADGRIFSGRQALEAGLVDKLGGSREAADVAGELGGLGRDPRIIREGDAWEQIFGILDLGFSGALSMSSGLKQLLPELSQPRLEYRWAY
ncbi:MAG: signal peptide peptidase SppA [bacterium]